jgi:fatty acid desaturase
MVLRAPARSLSNRLDVTPIAEGAKKLAIDIVTTHTTPATARRVPPATERGSPYAQLSREVKRTGLLNRRPGYYGAKVGGNLLLLTAGWVAFALIGRSWWQLLIAAFLAVMFTQTAFVGHDAGHHQISGSKRVNNLLGRLHGNLLVGLSYGWWISKHNRHHAHPNQVDRDPDIAGGAIAFTKDHARARSGPRAWLARHQAWLFFPMLLLEGLNLHVAGVRALLTRTGASRTARITETGLLTAHIGGYLTALFWVLSPAQAVCFILIQQGLFGLYMGCSFAPNHKGMPILAKDDKIDYLSRQVLTARNIRGGRLTDYALGGLNYQIEHHLFPSMPRPNLRRAQTLVRAFCAQHGVPYHETGLLHSYAQVLRHLHEVGGPLRPELEY